MLLIRRIWNLIRDLLLPRSLDPVVDFFYPIRGCPGIALEIGGKNFSTKREENRVTVGSAPALVVEASSDRLKIITSYATRTGALQVEVGSCRASGSVDFQALPWPTESRGQDGPPILYTGFGRDRDDCDMPSTGELRTLIVLCHPADRVPTDLHALRDDTREKFESVRTYYRQASYDRLRLDPTVSTTWCRLDSNLEDLSGAAVPPQAADYAAREALGETSTLEERQAYLADFTLIISLLYTNDERSFHPFPLEEGELLQYTNPDEDINIELHNESSLWTVLLLDETQSWDVWAHEIGHCMVSMPAEEIVPHDGGQPVGPWRWAAIIGEDLYPLHGVPMEASAARFDLMGSHRFRPLFSAYYMEQLGYYDPTVNISYRSREELPELDEEFEVVAHGVSENVDTSRHHLVKLQVAPGLLYYIEVRQRPDPDDPDSQLFDPELPVPYEVGPAPDFETVPTRSGGVLVTKVFVGRVNMNQSMRFITRLMPPRDTSLVLIPGDTVVDPARNLRITVGEDIGEERPLTCRVRVEWSPVSGEEPPSGDISLRVTQWNRHYVTPDIWINRLDNDAIVHDRVERRYDVLEHPEWGLDPDGNRDCPRVDTRNEVWGRVHCDGPPGESISDVDLTFYAITPPGVGDNGNWAPLGSRRVSTLEAGHSAETEWPSWYPEVGEHTCLKLHATAELPSGERLEASAQENVFEFLEAIEGSVCDPVVLPLAVRNPREERISALISVRNVPEGYVAHFPHRWVWLGPREERKMELTILPTHHYSQYQQEGNPYAKIKVNGWVKRYYHEEVEPGVVPPPCLLPMGGIQCRVTPKRGVKLHLWENQELSGPTNVSVDCELHPAMVGEFAIVDLEDPAGRHRVLQRTTDSEGRFTATFDLRKSPEPQADPGLEDEKPLAGVYVVKALIIHSPHAAKAESNFVYVRK
jgi:hypothetical protein